MRLIFVIDSLGSGGAQRLFINIVNGIANIREVYILLYKPSSNFFFEKVSSNVKIIKFGECKKNGFSFYILYQFFKNIKNQDLIVSFMPTANIYCFILKIFKWKLKQIVCEMSITNNSEGKFKRIIANYANKFSNYIICNSYTQTEYLKNKIKSKEQITTIWNGCENYKFNVLKNTTPKKMTIIIVGRVAYPKNGYRLLLAIQIFYERNKFIPCVEWYGRDDYDINSIKMKNDMVLLLKNNKILFDNFHFKGETKNILSAFLNADALLLPSIYEGVPNVICEAMMLGCPVIASSVSDNKIILGSNEERGFLCDPYSPLDICLSMERRIFSNYNDVLQLTKNARSFAEKSFSNQDMVNKFNKIINEII